jgi:phospholipid transport system substrate-binding protein
MSNRKLSLLLSTSVILATLIAGSGPSSAGAPTEQIKGTVDRAVVALRDPRFKSPGATPDRREQLRQILFDRFDFSEMAKRALGAHWRRRSPQEQEEFVRLFTELLERQYTEIVETYSTEKIVYVGERTEGSFAQVNSKVITGKGQEYSINYKAQLVGNDWKVYDVIAEDISLVNNFRSQFNRVISNSSFEELVRRLRDKQGEFVNAKS